MNATNRLIVKKEVKLTKSQIKAIYEREAFLRRSNRGVFPTY